MSTATKPGVERPKSKHYLAAEHKHKIAAEAVATAEARFATAIKKATAINWDTPLGESIKTRAEEDAAEKALKSAKTALKRAVHSFFIQGGKV